MEKIESGNEDVYKRQDEAYVNDIIATLGIENRIYNLPNQLSGGQQRCV